MTSSEIEGSRLFNDRAPPQNVCVPFRAAVMHRPGGGVGLEGGKPRFAACTRTNPHGTPETRATP